jgi:hypothetical protein
MAGDYVTWTGMKVHTTKSGIRAVDMRTGCPPTDSVMRHGVSFPVILPDQPYQHLGVRVTVMGDFSAEKQHALGDVTKTSEALREDRLIARAEREQVIVTAVRSESIFNCSAGIVD